MQILHFSLTNKRAMKALLLLVLCEAILGQQSSAFYSSKETGKKYFKKNYKKDSYLAKPHKHKDTEDFVKKLEYDGKYVVLFFLVPPCHVSRVTWHWVNKGKYIQSQFYTWSLLPRMNEWNYFDESKSLYWFWLYLRSSLVHMNDLISINELNVLKQLVYSLLVNTLYVSVEISKCLPYINYNKLNLECNIIDNLTNINPSRVSLIIGPFQTGFGSLLRSRVMISIVFFFFYLCVFYRLCKFFSFSLGR